MKSLYASFIFLPASLFAHSGHPGAEGHGDTTHLLIGLAVALPIALVAFAIRTRTQKKSTVKVAKQD